MNWAFEQGSGLLSAAKAVVQLQDGTTQPINLLKIRIGAEREMELIGPNARSIAHESAHTEIIAAFDSLESQIESASTIWSAEAEEGRS